MSKKYYLNKNFHNKSTTAAINQYLDFLLNHFQFWMTPKIYSAKQFTRTCGPGQANDDRDSTMAGTPEIEMWYKLGNIDWNRKM